MRVLLVVLALLMARTLGGVTSDRVLAATSASLDGADPVCTLLCEGYPTTLTSGRSLASMGNPGVSGWNLRLPDTAGNLELRYIRATTNLQYITSDTPLSSLNAWRQVMVTADLSGTPSVHIYHDEAVAGTLAEATYGTQADGSGTIQSAAGNPFCFGNNGSGGNNAFQGRGARVALFKRVLTVAEAEAWFAEPRGDDPDCVLFWCLGSSSPEIDFSGTTGGTMKRNNGTVTGTSVSDGSALPKGYVYRTVGSTGRMVSHPTAVVSDWLSGVSCVPTKGNFRYDFAADGETYTFTSAFLWDGATPVEAEALAPTDAASSKCCVNFRRISSLAGLVDPTAETNCIRFDANWTPGASAYLFDFTVPGLSLDDILYTYSGGMVSADSIQVRMVRGGYGCAGGSRLVRNRILEFNTGRPAASVVGFSVPGAWCISTISNKVGVGQESGSTRNFSSAPNGAFSAGFIGCTAAEGGGELYRCIPNHASAVVVCQNNIGIRNGTGTLCFKYDLSLSGSIDADYNLSDDATADDNGGTGHKINVTAANQFLNIGTGDVRLKAGSDAIDAGLDRGSSELSKFDILEFDRDASGATWDIGAHELVDVQLVVADVALALGVESPVLTQANVLATADALLALAAEAPVLSQANVLALADALLALSAEAPTLTQANVLAAHDALLALAAEAPALVQAHFLVLADAVLALNVEAVVLAEGNLLAPADVAIALAAENPALVQAHVLGVADSGLTLTAESPALTQANTLLVADGLVVLLADGVVLGGLVAMDLVLRDWSSLRYRMTDHSAVRYAVEA